MEGFLQSLQAFIDFILKIIAMFKSNDNPASGKKDE